MFAFHKSGSSENSMRKLKPLEGLRAVCVLSIVVGHQWDFFLDRIDGKDGNTSFTVEYLQAVTLFFLLSGIPLAQLYGSKSECDLRRASARKWFWLRRIFRLAPSYYLGLMIGCGATWGGQLGDEFQRFFWVSGLASVVMAQSWLLAVFINPPLWQVSVFCSCYLLFPSLVQRLRNRTLNQLSWLVKLCIVASVSLLIAGIALWGPYFGLAWHFHPFSRIPLFVAGVCLGEIILRLEDYPDWLPSTINFGRRTDLLSCILLSTNLIILFVWKYYGRTSRIATSVALESFGAPIHALWLIHVILAHNPNRPCYSNRFLLMPCLQILGQASYSIYCIHFPILRLYNRLIRSHSDHPSRGSPIIGIQTVPTVHFIPQLALVLAIGLTVHVYVAGPLRTKMVIRWAPARHLDDEEQVEFIHMDRTTPGLEERSMDQE